MSAALLELHAVRANRIEAATATKQLATISCDNDNTTATTSQLPLLPPPPPHSISPSTTKNTQPAISASMIQFFDIIYFSCDFYINVRHYVLRIYIFWKRSHCMSHVSGATLYVRACTSTHDSPLLTCTKVM